MSHVQEMINVKADIALHVSAQTPRRPEIIVVQFDKIAPLY